MPIEKTDLQTTIRMRVAPDQTLHGYVFTDENHARQWLRSYGDEASAIKLERVQVGPWVRCRCCDGLGHKQMVTKVSDVAWAELFDDGVL